jgi:hypothetical protein
MVSVAGVTALAGCGDDSDPFPMTGRSDSGGGGRNLPAWTDWLAAETFNRASSPGVERWDLQTARDRFPIVYNSFNLDSYAERFRIEEEKIKTVISVSEFGTDLPTLYTGSFSVARTEDALRAAGARQEESYNGFDIYRSENHNFALKDGVIVDGPKPKRMIDAKSGETERVVDSDSLWGSILGYVSEENPFTTAHAGNLGNLPDLSVSPERSLYYVTEIQESTVAVRYRLLFSDLQAADSVLNDDRQLITESIEEDGSLNGIERQQGQIILKAEIAKENIS